MQERIMRCSWVEERLVAFADGELSPGEAAFVAEHLDQCEACFSLDLRLRDITPEPALEIPAAVMAKMAAAVDHAVSEALDEPPTVELPSTTTRWSRWLRRDRDLSNGAMIAYGVVLAACLGWGISNWWAVQQLRADVESSTVADVAPNTHSTIDGTQYVPTSYAVPDEGEDWR